MTRLLLDENFPHSAALGMAQAGHDVSRVAAPAPGLAEEALALTAQALQGPVEGLFIVATARGLRRRPFAALAGDGSP
jgi:hypothetical protein